MNRTDPVDVTLFLPGRTDIVPARLVSDFNRQRPAGLPLMELDSKQSLRVRRFHCGRFGIDIALGPAQALAGGPKTLLGTGADAALRFPEATKLLADHRATLLISITDRVLDRGKLTAATTVAPQDNEMDEPAPPALTRSGGWTSPALVLRRLMLILAHRIAVLTAQQLDASALHWAQSDRLLPIKALAGPALPTAICFAPRVFSSGSRFLGRRLTGFRAQGSQDLLGRILIVHETALPLEQSTGFAADVLRHCLDNGGLPTDRAILSLTGCPAADVRLRPPSSADPWGTVELMIHDDAICAPVTPAPDAALRRAFGRVIPGPQSETGQSKRRFWQPRRADIAQKTKRLF